MAGVNKVILIGNLGADPETRYVGDRPVARMRLAVSESWKDQAGQRQERTEWVSLVAWGKKAEVVGEHLHKGSKIYVEGKLQTRSWDDPNGGGKRHATEIVIDEFTFLDARPAAASGARPNPGGAPGAGDPPEDDLPF